MIDRRESLDSIKDRILNNPDHLRKIELSIKTAVDVAIKYCRWNNKTAIPVYFPHTNRISLLLPLKLMATQNSQADIALVIEKLRNGNYQGQTIYTLDMAYQNARQICRPNSEWLVLDSIAEE